MNPQIWSFYDKATGRLTGGTFCGPHDVLERNTPAGCGAVRGEHDPRTTAVHLDTREVIPFERPAGEIAAEAAQAEAARARARIRELEAAQARAVRDFILTGDDTRVRAIEAQIAQLRPQLTDAAP